MKCEECGLDFSKKRAWSRFCSDTCRSFWNWNTKHCVFCIRDAVNLDAVEEYKTCSECGDILYELQRDLGDTSPLPLIVGMIEYYTSRYELDISFTEWSELELEELTAGSSLRLSITTHTQKKITAVHAVLKSKKWYFELTGKKFRQRKI